MDAANKTQNPIRVVMSPWLGYGHISPYLELAKKLIRRGFIIYLCSTPATLNPIQKKITKKLSESIKLVPLILPNLPGLPRNLHTTNGLPPHLMPKLKEAFASSARDLSNILADLRPDLLIYDICQPWAPLLAKDQNIPAVHFITCSSTLTCFTYHYFTTPDVDFPFSKIHFREYESGLMNSLLEAAHNPKEKEWVFEEIRRSCNIVLIKGFREIEGKYIDYVSELVGRKFVPVGPLVQKPDPGEIDDGNSDILSWLDKKEKKSTVYVSFGSEYFLSKDDIEEIAYGLEASKVNFVWIVRFPKGSPNGMLEKTLPVGFLERLGDRGKVVQGWAPQAKILGHLSIGGFVSHCGWNSVMESMYYGVPIIAMPMQIDQPLNARLVEEVGVGLEVLRDKNKKLDRVALAEVIKQVVWKDGGVCLRERVGEMRKKLESMGDEEIDQVVEELVALCNRKSRK